MRNLTLVIPGLMGPEAQFSEDFIPDIPALQTILARADHKRERYHAMYRTLADLMHYQRNPGDDIPVAAITRFMDNDRDTDGIWLRADPVHLSPDRNGLVLMDSFILKLSQHDALVAAGEVNKVLEAFDWTIEVPIENRWYLNIKEPLDLKTTELPSVVGFDIAGYLPRGNDSGRFRTLMNEIQMQLHAADINQLRESNGELTVNSVWFWGYGNVDIIPERHWSAIFSDDIFLQCLAGMTGTPCYKVPGHLLATREHTGEDGSALVVLQQCQAPAQYQNLQLWHKSLSLLEGSWFEPLLDWLKQGELKQLRIISDGHDFRLGKLGLRKFWRKPASIAIYRN